MPIEKFTSQQELIDSLNALENRMVHTEGENKLLREAVRHLQQRDLSMKALNPPQLPRLALLSPKFITRAFAVWGHYFVAQLIIGSVLFALYLVIIMILIASGLKLNLQPPM